MSPGSRLSRNLCANLANFGLNLLVGILFTPYLVRHLGVASFGIVPLLTTAVSYLSVFSLILNAPVARFVTFELERGNPERARRYFNTSLFASLALALALLVPALLISLNPGLLFRIPEGEELQARWFMGLAVAAFLLSLPGSAFEISTFCRDRFDLRNAALMAGTLVRVGLVVALFALGEPRLWQVGAGVALGAAVGLAGAVLVWRRITPELTLSLRAFDRGALGTLAGSGGWVALNQAGTLLLLSIDLLVVNRMFGPEAGGRYATLLQWSGLLRGAAATMAAVLAPGIVTLYARREVDALVRYAGNAVRYLGLSLALPVGLVSGLSAPLLRLWLGPEFQALAPLLTLMTAHLCLNLSFLPLHNVATATNDVRLPGLLQAALGIANLLLCWLLAGPFGLGLYGVAAAGAVVIGFKNLVFTPIFSARILGRGPGTFYRQAAPVLGANAAVFLVSLALARICPISSWWQLAGIAAAVSAAYGAAAWLFLIGKDERRSILESVSFAGGTR